MNKRDDMNAMYACEILPRLRFNTLQQTCKLVCKTWYSLIKSSDFVESHLKKSIQNHLLNVVFFNPTTNSIQYFDCDAFHPSSNSSKLCVSTRHYSILGSCNGLLCFGSNNLTDNSNPMYNFLIYNPTTGIGKSYDVEYLKILVECPDYKDNIGFGFGCSCDDYKLIFIKERQIHVYSLKLSFCRRLEDYSCKDCLWTTNNLSLGVTTKNTIHWFYGEGHRIKGIFSLDLITKKQFETLIPNSSYQEKPWLLPVKERLYMVSNAYSIREPLNLMKINVWVLNKYGKFHDCWTHLFKVELDNVIYSAIPMSLKEGGRKVLFELWRYKNYNDKKSYVWYDLITKTRDEQQLHEMSSKLEAVPCLETLVNPQSL
ncbi:hypothetical protein RDABS01_037552 [Bienertia sinuspersici]